MASTGGGGRPPGPAERPTWPVPAPDPVPALRRVRMRTRRSEYGKYPAERTRSPLLAHRPPRGRTNAYSGEYGPELGRVIYSSA